MVLMKATTTKENKMSAAKKLTVKDIPELAKAIMEKNKSLKTPTVVAPAMVRKVETAEAFASLRALAKRSEGLKTKVNALGRPTSSKQEKALKAAAMKSPKALRVEPRNDARKITLLVKENPKRGESARRFALYFKPGMTVERFLGAGGTSADLRWDVAHKFIKVG